MILDRRIVMVCLVPAASAMACGNASEGQDADTLQPVDAALAPDAPTTPMVEVTVRVYGGGTVASTPPGIVCDRGLCTGQFAKDTTVTLQAQPGDGVFAGWLGDCAQASDCVLEASAPRDVVARFGVPVASYARGLGAASLAGAEAIARDDVGGAWVATSFGGLAGLEIPLESAGFDDALFVHLLANGTADAAIRVGGNEQDHGTAVAVLPGGDVVVAGWCSGTVDFGAGMTTVPWSGPDAFIARYTPAGALVWAHRLGNVNFQTIGAVAVTSDGDVVAVGTTQGDGLDLGGGTIPPLGASAHSDGFVARYRADDGSFVSGTLIGGPERDELHALAVIDDDIVVAGRLQHEATIGDTMFSSIHNDVLFVARLDASAAVTWASFIDEGEYNGWLPGLLVEGGDVYAAGSLGHDTSSLHFGVLARLGPDGQVKWTQRVGDSLAGEVYIADLVSIGGSLIVGGTYTMGADLEVPATEGNGLLLAAFDPEGNQTWARGYPAPTSGSVAPLALEHGPGFEDVIAVGVVYGPLDLGPTVVGLEGTFFSLAFAASFFVTDTSL